MPIRIAMPIAHETNANDYASYYFNGNCVIRVVDYFNTNNCEGISLHKNLDSDSPYLWNLYAFTDGFLSFQNNSLVLRLPRELNNPVALRVYNSGQQFMNLQPAGPQLRHVVYRFNNPPGNDVSDKIRAILQNGTHPGQTIQRVLQSDIDMPIPLGDFLDAEPYNINLVINRFMNGSWEIFVQAGDVIGNFQNPNLSVELRFIDSCGNLTTNPAPPGGRPLNPAYYLFLVSSPTNTARVTMLTSLPGNIPNPLVTTHPLIFLLDPARVEEAGRDQNLALDLTISLPPPPLQITVPVQNAAGTNIANYGIPMRGLGEWHQSRNAANPFNTRAPVRWRLYGNQVTDNNAADYGRFITEAIPNLNNLLPGPSPFDHQFTFSNIHHDRVVSYWDRYGAIFNSVAASFQIPVEVLIATACIETSTGNWFNANNFGNSREMDIIRMEPLWRLPAAITNNAAQQILLTNYMNLTGGVGGLGANASIPIPWSGGNPVQAGNPITWDQLCDLIELYGMALANGRRDVNISPGIMQTTIETTREDFGWGASFYGNGFACLIDIIHNGVLLVADNPPPARGTMFFEWFGISVDAGGGDTNNAANVHVELTKMKRALHSIIAGAIHIKMMYNTISGRSNIITDFDLPTSFSGFNDKAGSVAPATPADVDTVKWRRLFALLYYGQGYPNMAPRFYNAAVDYFNTTPGINPLPAVRIWRG